MEKIGKTRGVLIPLVIIIALGALVMLARHGLIDLVRLTGQRDDLRAEVEEMYQRNQGLMVAVERLKTDPAAIEEAAREDLGLAREGEIVYLFNRAEAPDEERGSRGRDGTASPDQD
ncbi:MAG: septum formation initiator family protein [Deltaproteobacteria bacterium]|nr:septum formation initiator family protein [Deltaproteobacteria bacterium]